MLRRHAATGTLAALAMVLFGLPMAAGVPVAGAATPAGVMIKVTPSKDLVPGQVLTVTGRAPAADNGAFLAQCAPAATAVTGCDLASETAIGVTARGVLLPSTFPVVGPGDGTCTAPLAHQPTVSCGIALLTGGTGTGVTVTHVATVTFPVYYLSLGDSYSVGYQPPLGSTPGYTGYVASKLRMQLENFGCAGATTTSLTQVIGCGGAMGVQDPVSYPTTTQEQAALDFIASHPGQVGLLTVSIGGNDFDGCSDVSCVEAAMPVMESNIQSLMTSLGGALTGASDGTAPIIGLTYPDVELGLYVFPADPPSAADVTSAQNSILAFDDVINPTLSTAYGTVPQGRFVDVTSAPYLRAVNGDDTNLGLTENIAPYGRVPDAVGEVCQLTYFCSQGNIHANGRGYEFIGKLVVAAY